jgi:hypothetical protein
LSILTVDLPDAVFERLGPLAKAEHQSVSEWLVDLVVDAADTPRGLLGVTWARGGPFT